MYCSTTTSNCNLTSTEDGTIIRLLGGFARTSHQAFVEPGYINSRRVVQKAAKSTNFNIRE